MRKELIGHVHADSGRLVIVSPDNLKGRSVEDIDSFLCRCEVSTGNSTKASCVDADSNGRGAAVISKCGAEGCSYPVFAEYEEGTGRLSRIVIDMELDRVKYSWMGVVREMPEAA